MIMTSQTRNAGTLATYIYLQYVATAKTEATEARTKGHAVCKLKLLHYQSKIHRSANSERQLSKAAMTRNMGRAGTAAALSQHAQKTHIVSRRRSESFRSQGGKP